ncbi:MAG: PKD domain-containing protein [Actinobacteria bacterium]|nr:PKD domain-containing protein [Actinomycetota bacterium]
MQRRNTPKLVRVLIAVAAVTVVGLNSADTARAGSGTPAFATYAAPSSLANANNAGEPSIGVNGSTNATMYQAYSSTYKVTFNDATVPATATWANVTPTASQFNIDPILATDRSTGRTFAGGLAGECSVLHYSDNDGGAWTPQTNACAGAFDHQTIGSGPWAGLAPLGSTYSRAVYYCAQNGADSCVTSTNGGTTFGAPTLVGGACSSLHGHVKVSADGTAYLPNSNCSGKTGGGITRNNGSSWSSYTIAQSDEPARGFDPSVATTPDNTVYEAWMAGSNYHPMVGRSTDHGATWSRVVDLSTTVSPPIVASTFQAAVAGDNNRVAVAFLGTTVGSGVPFNNGYAGVWDLYVATSYDGGLSWTTVKATADPVQRGCIWDGGGSNSCRNLLDFMDANVSKDGRVIVGFADGCINTCATTSGTASQSTSAYATIARQSTGKGLFAAYDTAGNAAPTACFTHSETGLGTSTNGSCSSDTDGTISSYSWNWGDGSAASTGSTASHTYAAAGTYNTTLTVTDNGGATASSTQAITVATSGGGGTDPDPSTPTLSNGVAKSGTSGAKGTFQYFKLQVPTGKSSLKVDLKATQSCGLLGCNPDLDLFGRRAAKPTTTTYDAKTGTGSSTESFTIASPAADYWYVGVYVYSGSATLNYTITATAT